jgi:LysM repeat protein
MGSAASGAFGCRTRRGCAIGAALASGLLLVGCSEIHFPWQSEPKVERAQRATPVSSGELAYVVRKGDTLGQIATRYHVRLGDLMHANEIDDPRRLAVGRVLRIPAGGTSIRRAARSPEPRIAPSATGVASGLPPQRAAAPDASVRRSEVDAALASSQSAFDAADFEDSVAAADRARALLRPTPDDAEDRGRLARAYLLRGMAQVGLGHDDEALESFRMALEADRNLALDPSDVSPKIVQILEEARAR